MIFQIILLFSVVTSSTSFTFPPRQLITFIRRPYSQLPAAALLFDCDGVIILTEELHRLAYNEAWKRNELTYNDSSGKSCPVVWSVEYYDELQNSVGGGKPKQRHYFNNTAKQWPTVAGVPPPADGSEPPGLIDRLQAEKTVIYQEMVVKNAHPRAGVLQLMDEAFANPNMYVGVCSASTKEAVVTVLDTVLGPERVAKLDVNIAGDDCPTKKPDPLIYQMAKEKLAGKVEGDNFLVIEDSLIGCKAGKGAGARVLITCTESTKGEDFGSAGADVVLDDLGGVSLSSLVEGEGEGTRLRSDLGVLTAGDDLVNLTGLLMSM